jgi:hypothetical protein
MALPTSDAAFSLLYWLKNNTAATSFRALVYGGADYILEPGMLTGAQIMDRYKARETEALVTPAVLNQALFMIVHDTGESRNGLLWEQRVEVRIVDRGRGTRNILALRNLFKIMWDKEFVLESIGGKDQGVLTLDYLARTGMMQAREFDAQFETIKFQAIVNVEEQ